MNPTLKLTLTALALTLAASVVQAQALDGKTLFAKNCAACHQATGLGIPGAFPALKGNVFAQGDPTIVIATILKGRAGMPAFGGSLDDEKLATIITYVRAAWGNKAAAVTPADVTTVRSTASIAPAMHEKATIIH
ncbi:c-type cytochrome [Massilia sp. S19_KUP03_FR1]|uniref:c-type cytochrome n=1 Tax=Massilia sp. S19_KUP03_FR1 TaxID=3025503 RepID=UPI002FCD8631